MAQGRSVDFLKKLSRAGWGTRLKQLNAIVGRLNPLLTVTVEEKNGVKSEIIYSTESVVLVIQAYQDQIDALEARIAALETTSADHETRITALEP